MECEVYYYVGWGARSMTADQYIQKLFELSSQKLNRLREIFYLTEKQGSNITEDSIEELQEIINLKQHQMDSIDELDESFEIYYSRLKSVLGIQSLEDIRMTDINGAAQLKQIVATIIDITKQIQSLENENNKKAKDILNKLSNNLRQVNHTKIVNNGYNVGSKMPQQSYYFDKRK